MTVDLHTAAADQLHRAAQDAFDKLAQSTARLRAADALIAARHKAVAEALQRPRLPSGGGALTVGAAIVAACAFGGALALATRSKERKPSWAERVDRERAQPAMYRT